MRQSSALLLLLAWVLSHAGLSQSTSTPKGSSSTTSTLTSTLSTVDSQRHQRGLKKSGKGGKGGGKSGGKGKGKKKKKKKKKIKKKKGVHRIYRPIPRTLDGGKGGAVFPDDHSPYGTVVDPSAANDLPVIVVGDGGYHNHVPQQPETPPLPVVGSDGYYHGDGYHHTHGHGGGGGGYYNGGHSHGGGYYGGYYHSHGGGGDGGHSTSDSSGTTPPPTDDDGGGKGGAGSFRCTVPGTTDYPAYPWCPPGVGPVVDTSDDDDDDNNSYNDDDGTSTAPSYDGVQNYVVDFALIIDGDVAATLARIEAYLNDDLAAFLAGDHSTKPYTGTYQIARADFFVSQDTTSSPYCPTCTNADVLVHVYYTGGGAGEDMTVLKNAVFDGFLARCEALRQIEGVDETFDPCPTMQIGLVHPIGYVPPPPPGGGGVLVPHSPPIDDRGVVPIVTETSKSEESAGLGAGGAVGIAMAGLFLLGLLAAFFAMRRRRRGKDDGLRDVDEGDTMQDTFLTEPKNNNNNNSRDDDSRFGMYPNGRTDGMVLGERSWNQDVHKCSSATCELCERRRKNRLQFVPAKTMNEDTVNF